MSTEEKEKAPRLPKWHPETRADKNRKKDKEEKARQKGGAAPEPDAPAPETVTAGAPQPFVPDAFDLEKVRCGCGRLVFAMCMVDVRGVPAGIRGDAEEVCDGCWTGWVRKKKLSRGELAEYHGAPPELVKHIKENGDPHLP